MPRIDIVRESQVVRTARVIQTESLFDVPPSEKSGERWSFDVDLPEKWNVGLIVGPSGSGKSTVSRELFGDRVIEAFDWPVDKCVLDGFLPEYGIKDVTNLLSSVGFSSPPAWLRPFHALSTGQQFRVHVARALSECKDLCVIDEFTSVVDRTVAQIGSAAVARTARQREQKFVAVSCHYDIVDWLDPDWVMEMPSGTITRRLLQGRPKIDVEIVRVSAEAWELFRAHHYLDHGINKAARCYCALIKGVPVAFNATLSFPHPKVPAWRSHRTVCLPDFQGVGIGSILQEFVASMYVATGKPFRTTTSHPALIRARAKSKNWKMIRSPGMVASGNKANSKIASLNKSLADNRLSATFEYIGKKDRENAKLFGLISSEPVKP